MFKTFVTSQVIHEKWLSTVRVISGIIIFQHSLGIFNPEHMEGNIAWLRDIDFPFPVFMAYLGKLSELIGGISLILGFLVRFTCIPLVITMFVITFIMGGGEVLGNEQHTFLLLLIFTVFLSVGSGKWSLDHLIFSKKQDL
jgi:putative oxidoreductase